MAKKKGQTVEQAIEQVSRVTSLSIMPATNGYVVQSVVAGKPAYRIERTRAGVISWVAKLLQ